MFGHALPETQFAPWVSRFQYLFTSREAVVHVRNSGSGVKNTGKPALV